MNLSFKEYSELSAVLSEEGQLDEGKLGDWLKKLHDKLLKSGKSEDEIEAELEKEKKKFQAGAEKISQSQASKDFHARKAQREKEAAARAARQPQGTRGTVGTDGASQARAKLNATPSGQMRAAQSRAAEREFAMGEEQLAEGKMEFEVKYRPKGGGATRKWTTSGRDATDVRRKFADTHYGAKLITISPVKPAKKVRDEDDES